MNFIYSVSQVSNTKNFTSSFLKVLNGHSVRLANVEEEARRSRDQNSQKKINACNIVLMLIWCYRVTNSKKPPHRLYVELGCSVILPWK